LNWQSHTRRDVRLSQPAFYQWASVAASFGASSTDELIAGLLANPNFGRAADHLASKAEKAIALPGAQNACRRMHLNEWDRAGRALDRP
jgi:hypothetical protein